MLQGLQPATGAEALLAERGIGSETRARLRSLLNIAQGAAEPPPLSSDERDAAELARLETPGEAMRRPAQLVRRAE